MDFEPTPEMEKIRKEVREAISTALPPDWQGTGFLPMDIRPEHFELAQELDKVLAARNLLAPAWPKEYGGRGLTPYEQFALYEELGYALAPRLTTVAVDLVGPVLILYGTNEQRSHHLSAIANEGVIWSQGFSEPGAGSDLTGLRIRAERKGDSYFVNGSKIWTSMAHRADWIILLARTGAEDSRGRGLSLFLVPAGSPGIEIRPVYDVTNERMLNEVFFEDVEVPLENRIGEENEGWKYATTLLQYERGDALLIGQVDRLLHDLEADVRENKRNRRLGIATGLQLAQSRIEWVVGRLLTLRVVSMQSKGLQPDIEASQAKLFTSEAVQRLASVAHQISGEYGNLTHEDEKAPIGGRVVQNVLCSTTATIIAGTSEIQRTIIATRGLGMPRG